MNIDDELRRLFDDDRLDVAVRPDAEQVIVAGARRIRRRRRVAAVAAAVAVAVVLGSGIALAGAGRQSLPPAVPAGEPISPPTTSEAPVTTTTPPPATTRPPEAAAKKVEETAESTSSAAPPPPSYSLDVIGTSTYGPLRLFMSEQEALATGLLGAVEVSGDGCTRYTGTFGGKVVVSKRYGLVRIVVSRPASAAGGIHIGSTVAQVKAAYPNTIEYRNGLYRQTEPGILAFWVAGSKDAYAPWPETGLVDHIEIGASRSDCALAY